MRVLMQMGLVALGSAVGGLARWGIGLGAARWFGTAFPYGTLVINVTGSLFLGWVLTVLSERTTQSAVAWLRPDDLRLAIAVGFTGAYTTFSTFEWESNGLLKDGESLAATIYLLGSVLLGLLAVRCGILLARYV
jgi:fluoride exporter